MEYKKRRDYRFLFLCILFLSFVKVEAQEDTRHYIPPVYSRIQPGIHYLFLSTSKEEPFNVRIFAGDYLLSDTVVISKGNPKYVELGQRYASPGVVDASQLNKKIDHEALTLCAQYAFQVNVIHEARDDPYDYGDDDSVGVRLVDLFAITIDSSQIMLDIKKQKEDSIKFGDLKNGELFGKGSMVSKGSTILGTEFFVGCHLTNEGLSPLRGKESSETLYKDDWRRTIFTTENHQFERPSQFISIMATEDSTEIVVDHIPYNLNFHKWPYNKTTERSDPVLRVLNKGQSFVMATYPDQVKKYLTGDNNYIIGTKVSSSKPIALLSGAFFALNRVGSNDLGFDQMLPLEKAGKKFLVKEARGGDEITERVIVVATEDDTRVRINGRKTKKLNTGQFRLFNNFYIGSGFMYIESDKDICVFSTSAHIYAERFNTIPPLTGCDLQNKTYSLFLDLSEDSTLYTEELVRDDELTEDLRSELFIYTNKGGQAEVYALENDSLLATIDFSAKTYREQGRSHITRSLRVPKNIRHLYVTSSTPFTCGLENAFSANTYRTGFSSGVTLHVDTNQCSCYDLALCPYDSVRMYVDDNQYLDSLKWYKNDTLVTEGTSSFYALGPGKYSVSAYNSKPGCNDDFRQSTDNYLITLSDKCIYPEVIVVDTLEHTEKIAQEIIPELAVDVTDKSIFVPISFQFGSADLSGQDKEVLDKIAKYMLSDSSFTVKLIAHTDCKGEDKYNLRLSNHRAKNVYKYLVKSGVPKQRMEHEGVGETQPFNKCDCLECTEEDLAENRRLEFIINKED